MKIFVTGASGRIGSHLIPELRNAGHEVLGLASSEVSAQKVEAAGGIVCRGDIDEPEKLAKMAADSDGVIHLAFQHQLAWSGNFESASMADRLAVEAMGKALAGSDRPFVLASGMLGLTQGKVTTENDGLIASDEVRRHPAWIRLATSLLALSLRGIGVRSSVLRFPPTVHGQGDHGFIAMLFTIARQHEVSGYVGDGSNRWPTVHVSDAARPAWPNLLSRVLPPAPCCMHLVMRVFTFT